MCRYRDLPEIPLLLVAIFPLASLLLSRLRDVLPYAAYYTILGDDSSSPSAAPASGAVTNGAVGTAAAGETGAAAGGGDAAEGSQASSAVS